MSRQSFSYQAVVLKRTSYGEADRIVTLLSEEFGKHSVVARSVRKLNSTRLAALEPGTIIKAHTVQAHGMPLLSQAVVVNQVYFADNGLGRVRALAQWLELMDALFVEEMMDPSIYELVLHTRSLAVGEATSLTTLRTKLLLLIRELGFADEETFYTQSISQIVEAIADKPMKSYQYLSVQ